MKVFEDGRLYLEAGDKFPFMCPECDTYIPSDEAPEVIMCPGCQKKGTVSEFSEVRFFLEAKEVKQ